MFEPKDLITTEAQIREIVPDQFPSQQNKIIDHIDDHIRAWIERTPFITLATYSAEGRVDISPKGDPAGFVKVLDPHTIAIPDRPGNHRYDSFLNILETGKVAVMFLMPNRREVVRVGGTAQIARDLDLRESMAIKGRVPDFAIVVRVDYAFYHCGKAVLRANLWEPDKAMSVAGLPSYAEAVHDHAALPDMSVEDLETRFAYNEAHRMYDE